MSPSRANGLEFVAVVVVESHAIVESLERGDRLLYIALTRTTKYLTVVFDKGLFTIEGVVVVGVSVAG